MLFSAPYKPPAYCSWSAADSPNVASTCAASLCNARNSSSVMQWYSLSPSSTISTNWSWLIASASYVPALASSKKWRCLAATCLMRVLVSSLSPPT